MEKAPARLEKNELTSLERDCVEELLGPVFRVAWVTLEGCKVAVAGKCP